MAGTYRLVDAMTGMPAPPRQQARNLDPTIPRSFTGRRPNKASTSPISAKCWELARPIKINVGLPGPMRPAAIQHPLMLDEVMLAFPELTVIGVHLGHPWQREVIALLQKYPNFYLVISAWAPKYVPQEIWDVANTRRGINKIMWATDYPAMSVERCVREGWEVPLKEEARRRYLRDNALEVFRF